jgi:hypothetical protein
MGLIRKRPRDKIEISPIKLWGFVSIAFFIFSISVALLNRFSVKANDSKLAATLYAQETIPDAGQKEKPFAIMSKDYYYDPFTPDAEDPELMIISGVVNSARVKKNKDFDFMETGTPLENVTVTVYEGDPLSATGKTPTGAIENKFSQTFTNDEGAFATHARIRGSKEGHIYLAFHCAGRLADLKKVPTSSKISGLEVLVNCNDTLSRRDSPAELKYVDRSGFLECTTDIIHKDFDNVNAPTRLIATSSREPEVTSLAFIGEGNYDPRYANPEAPEGGKYNPYESWEVSKGLWVNMGKVTNGYESKGAFWEKDCVVQYEGTGHEGDCFFDDFYYGRRGEYVAMFFHNHIPGEGRLPAYRSVDNRSSMTSMNISPHALSSSINAIAGSYMGGSKVIKNPKSNAQLAANERFDALKSCESIEKSKMVTSSYLLGDGRTDINNTAVSVGPVFGLTAPFTWEQDFYDTGLSDMDLDAEYCKTKGGKIYTARDVVEDLELRRRYATPSAFMTAGPLLVPWTSENTKESGYAGTTVRGSLFFPKKTEAEQPYKSLKNATNSEGKNRESSGVRALTVTGSDVMGGRKYADIFVSPAEKMADPLESNDSGISSTSSSGYKAANEHVIWDINNYNVGLCSNSNVSQYEGIPREKSVTQNLLNNRVIMDNIFSGDADHLSNKSVNSGTYMSVDAELRDAELTRLGLIPNDVFDSLARAASGYGDTKFSTLPDDLKITGDAILLSVLSSVFGGGEEKTFIHRAGLEQYPKDVFVEYPLNNKNFEEHFPEYEDSDFPGEHRLYPWNPLGHKESCDVHAEEDGVKEMRTCKMADYKGYIDHANQAVRYEIPREICVNFVKVWRPHPETGRLRLIKTEHSCNFETVKGGIAGQTSTHGYADVDPVEIYDERYFDDPEKIEGRSTSLLSIKLERAGPMEFIAELTPPPLEEKMKQDCGKSGCEAEDYGKLADTFAEKIDYRFASPFSPKYKTRQLANVDMEFSKNKFDLSNSKYGYDTEGPGGNYAGAFVRTQTPTLFARTPLGLNEVTYHCNGFKYNVSGQVKGGDWECGEPPQCLPGTELGGLPSWANESGGCNVRSEDKLPFPVSDELLALVNGAANKFNVPGSVLLAVLDLETSTDISGDQVEKWSAENAVIAGCDPCADGIAVGPMQMFLKMAFEPYFSGGREGNNCNLADQLDAAANLLGSQTFKSCASWSPEDVRKAARLYRGTDDTGYIDHVMSIWRYHTLSGMQ